MTYTSKRSLATLIAIMVMLAACSFAPGPGATVREFFVDADAGRITDAMKLVNVPAGFESKVSGALADAARNTPPEKRLSSVEIVKQDVRGEVAHVEYILHLKDKSTTRNALSLQKIDGKWKILMEGLPEGIFH